MKNLKELLATLTTTRHHKGVQFVEVVRLITTFMIDCKEDTLEQCAVSYFTKGEFNICLVVEEVGKTHYLCKVVLTKKKDSTFIEIEAKEISVSETDSAEVRAKLIEECLYTELGCLLSRYTL